MELSRSSRELLVSSLLKAVVGSSGESRFGEGREGGVERIGWNL